PSGVGRSAIGDCEDIALQKRLMLINADFPADRLFFAVVFSTRLGLHTVLIARLDRGDYVLDSASGAIREWQDVSYSWLRIQSPSAPRQWYRVAAKAA
ncbi:MAG: transglutaminase-like cysteine peptidase, partial [Maritimibacter sp.]